MEVVSPKPGTGEQELVLPGDVAAFTDAQIRARVNGYIREWKHDIGAHVKAGETLAIIDAPELEQQTEQAKGEQARAEAHVQLAKLTSKRWAALRASTAVSQQSVDEKSGDFNAKIADVAAARANVERLKALQGFTQVVAPFTGLVTRRNIDVGVLVGPGNGQELFAKALRGKARYPCQRGSLCLNELKPDSPCGQCAFWRHLNERDGSCHLRAPEPIGVVDEAARWARTHFDAFCGEGRRREDTQLQQVVCSTCLYWRHPPGGLEPVDLLDRRQDWWS